MPLITFPALPEWATTLAGILPLATLIEFVDVDTRLHVYELRGGAVPYWNWPVTPSGARCLLLNDDTARDCLLDQPQRSIRLTCVDGREQNQYPCSAPTTTRLWAATQEVLPTDEIENKHPNMMHPDAREQVLRFWISVQESVRNQRALGPRYLTVATVGWLFWLALVTIGLGGGLYIAGAYLLLMPLTGFVVGLVHGTKARAPLTRATKPYPRLIIAPGSENPHFWFAFLGLSTVLNGLLNISLTRTQRLPYRKLCIYPLRLLILSQWALALGSSATEGWDAYFIATWTTFCIVMSAYGYPADLAARDWLERDCNIRLRTIRTKLSGRWPMLIALGVVNPDKQKGKTSWMDPFVKPDKVRQDIWEAAIDHYYDENEEQIYTLHKDKWWTRLVVEGVMIGKEVERKMADETS
ncbi:hypothetical protein LZ30DRAFT_657369 [Colletotrichum cereale]|nr:hypothetical protein LZ30DRAFT_657369 [Colletotrichum cereale]